MKPFNILILSAMTFSCVPQQKEAQPVAQHPLLQKQTAANVQAKREQKNNEKNAVDKTPASVLHQEVVEAKQPKVKVVEVQAPEFTGNYFGWIVLGRKLNGYGVLSINKIDEEKKTVSLSTLMFGKRRNYTLPYQMPPSGHTKPKLKVNTKKFNLFSVGEHLMIDLIDGVSQNSPVEMRKMNAFEHDPSVEPDYNRAVYNANNREFLSYDSDGDAKFPNASAVLLKPKDVENLRAVDLEVIKNSIYARHGLSFDDPRMANFFSENDWYTPIFTMTEVKLKLSKMEVKNIQLITRFEKHAKRYYEEFGR